MVGNQTHVSSCTVDVTNVTHVSRLSGHVRTVLGVCMSTRIAVSFLVSEGSSILRGTAPQDIVFVCGGCVSGRSVTPCNTALYIKMKWYTNSESFVSQNGSTALKAQSVYIHNI